MAENIFDHVLENVDIYDVVKDFMDLEPKGDSYFGLCPFHNDVNKPSLSVKRSEQFFYCFTCKVGGSAIDFVSKRLNLTKIEATRYIANKYNIDVHEYDKRSSRDIKYEKYHERGSCGPFFIAVRQTLKYLIFNDNYGVEKEIEVELFTWEKLDYVDAIKTAFNL